MQLQGKTVRVCIYIGENNQWRGRPLYLALLKFLKEEGASGATASRGLAGFGAGSRIHTSSILTLSAELPVVVEWVDMAERVDRLMPQIRQMVADGLITKEAVAVIQYAPGRWPDPLDQPVRHIMRTEVISVPPGTPLAEAVSLLLERGYRSLPVTDERGRLLGIITDGDLLRRAGLTTRLGLQSILSPDQVQAQWTAMQQAEDGATPLVAQSVMSTDVVTLGTEETIGQAIARMAEHDLKRLPVVDERRRLVGLVSRVDLLRVMEHHQLGQDASGVGTTDRAEQPRQGHTISELMYTDIPTVPPEAGVETILQVLETSRRRRAVVVDANHRVLGIISDGDLLRRSRTAPGPGLLDRVRRLMTDPASHGPQPLPAQTLTAAQIMSAPAITINAHADLSAALHLMMEHGIKRLPVVDGDGRMIGLLGRASLLRGLVGGDG